MYCCRIFTFPPTGISSLSPDAFWPWSPRTHKAVNDRARIIEALSKLGIGVVAILVLAFLFGTHLYKQIQFEEVQRAREERDRDRVYELMKRQSTTTHDLASEQNEILRELVVAGQLRTAILEELREVNRRMASETVDVIREELYKTRRDMEFHEKQKIEALKDKRKTEPRNSERP